MRPTDVLRDEHEHILRGCAVLHAMAERLEAGGEVDAKDAATIVDFIRFYADGLHHAKEEHVLFPALTDAGMPRNGGPVAVMLYEHDRGREHVAGMLASLEKLATPGGRETFAENARGFANLLDQHIGKENGVLFMMADRLLPSTDDAPLLDAYATREAEARSVCGDKPTHEAKLADLVRRWL